MGIFGQAVNHTVGRSRYRPRPLVRLALSRGVHRYVVQEVRLHVELAVASRHGHIALCSGPVDIIPPLAREYADIVVWLVNAMIPIPGETAPRRA